MDALPGMGLPAGWASATLGELCDVIGGLTVDAKRGGPGHVEVPYLRVANVQRGRLDLAKMRTIRVPEAKLEALTLQPGDVLLNEGGDRDKVGRGWVWEDQLPQCVFQNHVFRARVRDDVVCPYFLSLYLNEFGRDYFLTGAKQTTNLASLSLSAVKGAPVVVPPRAEQDRIVAAVNALFEEVEAGEAALARAREGLTQFRVSLLHAACTGALTADWRAANPTNQTGSDLLAAILRRRQRLWEYGETARGRRPSAYQRPPEAVAADLPSLPAGWAWATVAQLSFVSGGLTKNASRNDSPMQLPYLRVANVGEDRIDLTDLRKIGVTEGELPRIALLPGDLLFVEGNGSADQIGRVALWSGQVRPCVHQNHLIKARPVRRFLGRWMRDWFMSPLGKQLVQAAASSTSGLHTLSISKIEGLPVPIPPAAELRRILPRCAEMKREHADGALVLDQQSDALSSLRQSILHAAFTGRLVPQDPADEPAAALLARLRAAPSASRRPRARRTATQPDLIETPA